MRPSHIIWRTGCVVLPQFFIIRLEAHNRNPIHIHVLKFYILHFPVRGTSLIISALQKKSAVTHAVRFLKIKLAGVDMRRHCKTSSEYEYPRRDALL